MAGFVEYHRLNPNIMKIMDRAYNIVKDVHHKHSSSLNINKTKELMDRLSKLTLEIVGNPLTEHTKN